MQKTYTTVDRMVGAPPLQQGMPLVLTGMLTNGRTPASHLEYWVRSATLTDAAGDSRQQQGRGVGGGDGRGAHR